MDKTFFGIVRHFGLGIALLTLLGTIGGVAWAIFLFNSPVDEKIVEPKVAYQDFKNAAKPNASQATDFAAPRSASEQSVLKQEPDEFDRKFEAHLKRIIEYANTYFRPEFSIREDTLRTHCKDFISDLPSKNREGLALAFMTQFESATAAFVADKGNLENIGDPSEKGRKWDAFSRWMFESFRKQVAEQTERIERERAEAALKKEQAKLSASAAAFCFTVFMLFTLMLVLLAIERNTRPQVAVKAADSPSQLSIA